jgi:glutathione S-transferase
MKLYYAPGACSLSPHIALKEAGIPFDLVKVDLRAKKMEDGSDYLALNPKGQVPAVGMDNGDLLTEGAVIVQMIADKVPGKNLVPPAGTAERYRAQEWLNFVGSELHKNFSPLFNPAIPDDVKQFFRDRIMGKFTYINGALAGQDYLMGSQFTVPDGYLFAMLRWADTHKFDVSGLENLVAYKARVAARPMVQEALQAEGLMNAS